MDASELIDWESRESHLLLNPRMPHAERALLESRVVPLDAHVWVSTSGSSGELKLVALSKQAILASAAAVNEHLGATQDDSWCCVLPHFHVAGLGIHARAWLSGSRVEDRPWDPHLFASSDATLASLVPAQLSDLVSLSIAVPQRLRAVILGGGAVRPDLLDRALSAGWPVLQSYGLTETASQIATAASPGGPLRVLRHAEVRIGPDGRVSIRADSLLTGYGTQAGLVDPKVAGWFQTEDLGSADGGELRITGRIGEFIKIGGESVDLVRLDAILGAIAGNSAALFAMRDDRLGQAIGLAVEPGVDGAAIEREFAARVHPFERPRRRFDAVRIPRTSLGKLRRNELSAMLIKR